MAFDAKAKWLQAMESLNTTSSIWDVYNELKLQEVNDLGDGGAKAVGITEDGGLDVEFDEDWCKDVEANVKDSVDDEVEDDDDAEEEEAEASGGMNIAIMVG